MAKTNKGLADYAIANLGNPYWYGTVGQRGSEELYIDRRNDYPRYYDGWPKSSFEAQYGKRVHDCVGLIKGYLWRKDLASEPVYNHDQDLSANGMYGRATKGGSLNTLPEEPGICLWKQGHTGVYIGNGRVVEARGHDYGIVMTDLGSRGWEQWYQCPFISQEPQKQTYNLFHDYLRKGSKGAQVVAVQAILEGLGYRLPKYGVDGDFGSETEAAVMSFQRNNRLDPDGVVGPLTGAKIFGI